jgi:hypothetical protein
MIRDEGDLTTISVVRQDADWMRENVPGGAASEKFAKLVKFWEKNYNRPNIAVWAEDLNEELDPLNRHIIEGINRMMGKK